MHVVQLSAAGGELPCVSSPELFFAEHPSDIDQAKQLCSYCPVRLACLQDALQRAEPCGVWGGELLLRGSIIAGKRARGRPRKTQVAA
ncbi:MAG TPA: WhiB family transcriptional regulator [Streptosporangiaceae bacterium]